MGWASFWLNLELCGLKADIKVVTETLPCSGLTIKCCYWRGVRGGANDGCILEYDDRMVRLSSMLGPVRDTGMAPTIIKSSGVTRNPHAGISSLHGMYAVIVHVHKYNRRIERITLHALVPRPHLVVLAMLWIVSCI